MVKKQKKTLGFSTRIRVPRAVPRREDAVMSNIFSNACAGAWAWPKALQVLQDERQRCGGAALPGEAGDPGECSPDSFMWFLYIYIYIYMDIYMDNL